MVHKCSRQAVRQPFYRAFEALETPAICAAGSSRSDLGFIAAILRMTSIQGPSSQTVQVAYRRVMPVKSMPSR